MKKMVDTSLADAPAALTHRRSKDSLTLNKKAIHHFLKEMQETERSRTTIESYRQNLFAFYDFLPTDKRLDSTSLLGWREYLISEEYSASTINSKTSAVNSFYNFIGKRDWQITNMGKPQAEEGLELSRREYRLLLEEARRQENIQLYLIVKVLACADLTPSDLILLTREAVNEGLVRGKMRGVERAVILPAYLLADLRDYVVYRNIRSGPVFLNGNGNPYSRTVLTRMIGILGGDIGLEPGKATPRNLRKLYLSTLADFQEKADAWVTDSYLSLLKQEESEIGWRSFENNFHGFSEK